MAYYDEPEKQLFYQFSASNPDVSFEMKNGMIDLYFPIDFFRKNPEIHQYFNAEDALEHMSAWELDRLRKMIAPEVTRLNIEVEKDLKEANRTKFKQLTTFQEQSSQKNIEYRAIIDDLKTKHAAELQKIKETHKQKQESYEATISTLKKDIINIEQSKKERVMTFIKGFDGEGCDECWYKKQSEKFSWS